MSIKILIKETKSEGVYLLDLSKNVSRKGNILRSLPLQSP